LNALPFGRIKIKIVLKKSINQDMKQILFWGKKTVGQRLKQAYNKTYIAKNFLQFEDLINEYDYISFYVDSSRTCLKKLLYVIRKYREKTFYIIGRLDDKYPNYNVFEITKEQNTSDRPLGIKEFIASIQEDLNKF
jgi:hypothetical protein